MFDGDTVRCAGTVSISNRGRTKPVDLRGRSQEWRQALTRFQYDAAGKLVREELAGTGICEGMVTTGVAKEVEPPREILPGVTTFCNQATGTCKMK